MVVSVEPNAYLIIEYEGKRVLYIACKMEDCIAIYSHKNDNDWHLHMCDYDTEDCSKALESYVNIIWRPNNLEIHTIGGWDDLRRKLKEDT